MRQLNSVASGMLVGLAERAPLLPAAEAITWVDVDDTMRATYGYARQRAGYGYSKVKGIDALIGVISTPAAAPVIGATRLRRGSTNSARGAAKLVADTLATARRCGAGGPGGTGLVVFRADSAYYNHDVIAVAIAGGARFSVTARMDKAVQRAIANIGEDAWTPIHYPNAVWDEDEQRLVSDAQVAEIESAAFTSRRKSEHIDGRLSCAASNDSTRLASRPAGRPVHHLAPPCRVHRLADVDARRRSRSPPPRGHRAGQRRP
jgi:hypothetical protein